MPSGQPPVQGHVITRQKSALRVPQDEWYETQYGSEALTGENLANFIKKVYGILTVQMTITVAMCVAAMYWPPAQRLVLNFVSIPYINLLLFVPVMCVLCALQANKAVHPLNWYLLITFTILMSLSVASVCGMYAMSGRGVLILQAFGITMGTFLGLTLYALFSGKDFTWMGGMLYMGLMGMIFMSFFGWLFGFSGGILMPICGVILFIGFILYDTSRILKVYGPDDAMIASIELYLDILNLFLYILELLGSGNGDE